MKLKDIIFVPSVQHTGTWFVLRLLEKFGYEIKTTKDILDGKVIESGKKTVIHTHFPITNNLNKIVPNDPFELRTYNSDAPLCINSIVMLSNMFKTVVPIRDPLAAMLTREARHPELRHFFIVDGFVQMANYLSDNSNTMFFPVDLLAHKEKNRRDMVLKTLKHCGIEIDEEAEGKIDEVVYHWKAENDTPNNRFKELYKEKDIFTIDYLLGAKIAEVEYLKNKAAIIHPFLFEIGYTKGDLDLW
ncbi:MAG: hypothetical protein GY821_12660 [Gammaproteobacteria bacterium]|nr:hypothetical protein [Gammaproteobacteria bacterium]